MIDPPRATDKRCPVNGSAATLACGFQGSDLLHRAMPKFPEMTDRDGSLQQRGSLRDLLGHLVDKILDPGDRSARLERLWAAVAFGVLLGLLGAFVSWRNR